MPIAAILLLVVLAASFRFWGTLKGMLGAMGIVIVVVLIATGIVITGGLAIYSRYREKLSGR